ALERLGLLQLTKMPGGFIAGDRRRTQRVPGAPAFLPLICYEIIFPGDAVPHSERSGWLYNHLGRYIAWPFVAGSGERPGWVLDAPLPQGLAPTAYARVGDGPLAVMLAAAALWLVHSRRRKFLTPIGPTDISDARNS